MISSGRLGVECAESAVITHADCVLDKKNQIWFSGPSLTFQGWWLRRKEEGIFWFLYTLVSVENKLKKGEDKYHTVL